ncbi:hypothetical protein K8089_10650 [Aequorivita sp. F47161]|uniref:Uncharacterized protein n=1 Tax=Aequorivita vitellina TaxID=2874475 RepID=A0A9X1QY42_9FLAO|nr:hypothetical protein [Aequorivita vitellina]MCG2419482.1 hypothetical protein [Aequorivita vitellina]
MHKDLLIRAFETARKELIAEGNIAPSDSRCAMRLSEVISETFPYGEKSLRKFYKKAMAEDSGDDIQQSRPEVLNAMAKYLGYSDYKAYLIEIREGKAPELKKEEASISGYGTEDKSVEAKAANSTPITKGRNKVLLIASILSVLLFIGFFGYSYVTKQRWMEWQETHYIETSFDAEKLKAGVLKVYKEERIESFRKLFPNCATQFFNEDDSVRLWYGKNREGKIEYFSSYGLHPETNKTLRPITKYIIEKYVCN